MFYAIQIDFDELSELRLSHPDIGSLEADPAASLAGLLDLLSAGGINAITREVLATVRVTGIGPQGDVINTWALRDCLDGQIARNDRLYLANAGRYSALAASYVEAVNARIDAIQGSTVVLPNSHRVNGKEISEGAYNVLAADSNPSYLLMDKRNVTIPGKTSPIEVCDILTPDRLVHVKRKFASGTLSHLFSQGETSGTLPVDSAAFRAAVRAKITEGGAAVEPFAEPFAEDTYHPANFEIVYAIIGDWNGRALNEKLPFFSKVNLLTRAQQLRRAGYTVTYARIDVD